MERLHESLSALRQYPQFILVDGKTPVNAGRTPVDPHSPANWLTADDAVGQAGLLGLGVGFVFTANDPFWFLDIDHCLHGERWSPIAEQLLRYFNGAAAEISVSGEGLHIFGAGHVPEHSKKNKTYGIEFYTEGRYVLLTGNGAAGSINLDWSDRIGWLVDTYFPPRVQGDGLVWRDEPVPEWSGPESDEDLIAKILASRGSAAAVMGGRATARDLFTGSVEVLARCYPTQNDSDPFDRSSADAALATQLAFWTGKNHERIKRLMYQSALYREKWDTHPDYMERTVTYGVNGCKNVYGARGVETSYTSEPVNGPGPTTHPEPAFTAGGMFMTAQQQVEYFKGCVYLKRNHGVLTPNGTILKPEQFRAAYAGYSFQIEATNETRPTRNAWEAFIENQVVRFPKVDGVCFRPQMAAGAIIEEEGMTLVNTYVPVNTPRKKGDVSLFLDHMAKLIPNKQDREIVLSYMRAVVQHQGTKFQWCPIIQGAEGNGKTIISRVIERAVGSRYVHYPNAGDLAGNGLKFNGWVECKVYIGIEEIYVSDRRELTEPMKPFITNDRLEIQHKGMAQYTGDNLANIIMFSNHKDCMKMTYDQRRYFMVFTNQQGEQDLRRDGMDNAYFKRLYDWLKHEDGYAMVSEWLWTTPIADEINPAGICQRAPVSSNLPEAVASSLGTVEQHILEAIEEERPGFRGNYISSKCLADLLREIRMDNKISPYRSKQILESLGYHKHPWLGGGRLDSVVDMEGIKPRLYYRGDLPPRRMPAAWVKQDYEEKQGYQQTLAPGHGGLQVVR